MAKLDQMENQLRLKDEEIVRLNETVGRLTSEIKARDEASKRSSEESVRNVLWFQDVLYSSQ